MASRASSKTYRFGVVTVSDRAAAGVYADKSGPAVVQVLAAQFPTATIETRIVPDDADAIRAALRWDPPMDAVLTTGGTGLGPRDITPEVTREYCEREVPGLAEFLRYRSAQTVPSAVLSRGYCGVAGKTLYINVPGSTSGARQCTELVVPVLAHAVQMLAGGGHG